MIFFWKRIWQNQNFLFLPSCWFLRQTTGSQPILQTRYSRGLQLFILHNFFLWHLLDVLLPFHVYREHIAILRMLSQRLPVKQNNPKKHRNLGHWLFCVPDLTTDTLYVQVGKLLLNSVLFGPTNTIYITNLIPLEKAVEIILPLATITALILWFSWSLWQSLLSLGLSQPDELLAVNIDPASLRRQKQLPGDRFGLWTV